MNYWFFQSPEDPDSEGKAEAAAKTHSGIFRSTLALASPAWSTWQALLGTRQPHCRVSAHQPLGYHHRMNWLRFPDGKMPSC